MTNRAAAMLRTLVVAALAVRVSSHDGHGGSGGGEDWLDQDKHCPGSSAGNHAWFATQVEAHASCDDVRAEIKARVAGQDTGDWKDPHDGGGGKNKYMMQDAPHEGSVHLHRKSSNGKYTDAQLFTFEDKDGGHCLITACSESQSMSMADQSTNYCNLRNLYCGSAEECCHVNTDFAIGDEKQTGSNMAGKDASMCLGGKGGSGSGAGGEKSHLCDKVGAVAETVITTLDPHHHDGGSGEMHEDPSDGQSTTAHGGSGDMDHSEHGGSGAEGEASTTVVATTPYEKPPVDDVSGAPVPVEASLSLLVSITGIAHAFI